MLHFKEEIEQAISQTGTMREAAVLLQWPYRTFIYRAQQLGLYKPNQASLGQSRPNNGQQKQPIECYLQYGSATDNSNLKKRLLVEGLIEHKCVECDNDGTWKGKPLTLQLDHINGDSKDNRLENLRLLCPNCHTQTDTWGGRNKNKVSVDDETLLTALQTYSNIRQALRSLNMSISKTNYDRAKTLKLNLMRS